MHIWETFVHMCTKYEVSMSNSVLGGRCAQMTLMPIPMLMSMTHDGQSMIIQGSLVDKPNEPKT